MKICAAQLALEPGNIERNTRKHETLVRLGVDHRADLIFFPELSLTGYEPKLAKDLAIDSADPRLDVFQWLADDGSIAIGVGVPMHSPDGVRIAMVVFRPRGARLSYAKQLLHPDETPFFVAGDQQLILPMGAHVLAPSICFESLQPAHADLVAESGVDVYLASVAKPLRNIEKAYAHYPDIAAKHSMVVLAANTVGPSDDFIGAGRSAAWNSSGRLVAKLGDRDEGIVMFDTSTQDGRSISM